jgi:hypothetical protein
MVFAPLLAVEVLSWEALALLVANGITLAVLNWLANREQKKQAHDGAKAGAEAGAAAAVQPVAEKMDKVYEQVNGNGLTGAVKRLEAGQKRLETGVAEIKAEQKAHAGDDEGQFGEIRGVIGLPPWAGRQGG